MVDFKVDVKLAVNREAIEQLLTSPAVFADVKRRADRIADGANAGVEKQRPDEDDPYLSTELVLEEPRAAASVITRTNRGKRDNLCHGTLLKNLDRGR